MNGAEIKGQNSHLCDIFGLCTCVPKYNFKTNHNSEVTVDECTLVHSSTLLYTTARDTGTSLKTKMNCCRRRFICNSNNNYYDIYSALYFL